MEVSNLIGHCVDHAHYPSTVPHVIASVADLLKLVQPQTMHGTASWLETRLDRQDAVLKTNRQVHNCALLKLVQPQTMHGTASWLETRLDRQDAVLKTNR